MKDMIDFMRYIQPDDAEKGRLFFGGFLGMVYGVTNFALGGIDRLVIWLAIFAAIDYITGTVAAFKTGNWNSSTGFKGLGKKALMFVIVAICHGLDVMTGMDMLRSMSIMAYGVNEAGSVIENMDACGWTWVIPRFLRRGLQKIREEKEEKVEL
ncbi:MAG: phage holin family protein [Acidaminococcaceae bacterium]|nr:phage holin family protein [Acidaminococcaceae bacterium]